MAHLHNNTSSSETDLSLLPVPKSSRMPRFALTMAWWGVCSAMFYIVVAATLALKYGALNAIIGMVLSVISYGLINTVISRYAIRTGLSVALFSRILFGSVGASLAILIFAATAIYYAVFEGSVIAVALTYIFPSLPYKLAVLIIVVSSVLLILGSVQNWLNKLNGVLLPVYLLGLLAAVALATQAYGYKADWLSFGAAPDAGTSGWWHCFVYYMGIWILMMFTFDYARFGKRADVTYHGRYNFGMPFYLVTFLLNGVAGIYLVSTIPTDTALSEVSVVLALLKLMGIWGLLFVWGTQTRINTANYYLATMNLQVFGNKLLGLRLSKLIWALVVGVIVYLLMLSDIFSYLLQALAYQGVLVVAWVGVALVHILSDNEQGQGRNELTQPMRFNPIGLSAWAAGAGSGLILMHLSERFNSFAAPTTFAVSVLVYALFTSTAKRD